MRRFWETASEAQKFAQIEGGIECGLSYAEIAMACNGDYVNPSDLVRLSRNIRAFAYKHGIKRGFVKTRYAEQVIERGIDKARANRKLPAISLYWIT